MRARWWIVAIAVVAAAGGQQVRADEVRSAPDRPDIIDVGSPILITRAMLAAEMRRNTDLRDWVRLYGAPDYAEVQEIQIEPPFAPYEVRLYYVRQNAYLAFGRVHVAPNVYDYGVRKYGGPINAGVLDRLLTAKSAAEAYRQSAVQPVTAAPGTIVVETEAVEGMPVPH